VAEQHRLEGRMRFYWPKEKAPSILDGTWKPPAVTRVN
jgi:hypothetical protein